MLRSCSYCGGIHDHKYQCPNKPIRKQVKDYKRESDNLRNTNAWRKKSKEIRQRDKGLCQICIRDLYHTTNQYTFDTIEVHHIVPLVEGGSLLSNHNLLTLCKFHHNLCENGDIPRQIQMQLALEQESKNQYI